MDHKDEEDRVPPFPDHESQSSPPEASENSGLPPFDPSVKEGDDPVTFEGNAQMGEENDTVPKAAEPSQNLTAEDFLREPDVNYVRSSETLINIGDDIGLSNKDAMLKNLKIGAGWTVRTIEGDPPDLDLSCFLLNKKDLTRQDEDFVFYNQIESLEGEVKHKGDSRTGAGEGDDENIEIFLQKISFDIMKINFVISIHDAIFREHNFSMVRNLFFRLVNLDTDEELCRLEIPNEHLQEVEGVAMLIGSLFRDGQKWRFHAMCEMVEGSGLAEIARKYGLLVP